MFLDDASKAHNFRQVGTKHAGSVRKGHVQVRPVQHQKPSASIPSKFETILNAGERETNAFGSRTNRFGDAENELPGPGAYYKPPTLLVTTETSGSVSQKGYGTGFVSKVKRFSNQTYETVPGPGQYTSSLPDKPSFNRRIGLSSFAPTERSNNQASSNVPGPGNYNVKEPRHNAPSGRSAFVSKSHRGFVPRSDVPAPGQYENPIELGRDADWDRPQGIFRSSVKRVETPKTLAVPGPGAYGVEAAEKHLLRDTIAQAQASSMFKKGAADRFGHLSSRKGDAVDVPGPGAYDGSAPQSTAVVSSVFKSSTKRGQDLLRGKAPGPAFYKPAVSPTKRSHLLNGTKKWL
ncbi:hypothetical protein SPRG_00380 [Saprolegnia parasitica CBS 223.65]|uniref:Sperm-tail PG-rich repeat-containing protein 2 n=1 Tax=Saprolegnia parasitica (strain CBS 223.65) TaxID=695850 RepID=A0A067CXV1_SAPPC|nr:hypothetical protein SPRG_00380 [Saprolegnia parasitica CBS 223.65]KDO35534.1 hypothetical protein SPRG_00380 [Saprolegnia parasitica CBS 223.65]|eukprot:XP_012193869.1 hypothetical protein SPRG_00380 [Saprolegnia parasitica CBS 223.65]